MIRFMLPLLIANQGGRWSMGSGRRGRGGGHHGRDRRHRQPMFLGAMIMGPLAAWCMKHVDKLWEGKIKPGFEMLVNNFSAGILAAALAVIGHFVFGPPIETVSNALGDGVDWLVDNSLLPLASLIIEPAKVLFLNNAINHGVLTPLGIQQAAENGKSILFLLEANPGRVPGCCWPTRCSAPWPQHRPGGVDHPVLRRHPRDLLPVRAVEALTILATIAGGMVGIFTLVIFGAGLRAGGSRVDHRGVRPDAGQQPGRGHLVGPVGRGDRSWSAR